MIRSIEGDEIFVDDKYLLRNGGIALVRSINKIGISKLRELRLELESGSFKSYYSVDGRRADRHGHIVADDPLDFIRRIEKPKSGFSDAAQKLRERASQLGI